MVKTSTFLAALLVLVALAIFLGPWRPAQSRLSYLSVCTVCGLQESVKESKLGPLTFSRQTVLRPTPISEFVGTNGCRHTWLLYDWGTSGRAGTTASLPPAGQRKLTTMHVLLSNKMLASELGQMENPRQKWQLLVTSLQTNRALEDSLLQWSQALPYRSFRSWWQQSSLGKNASP